MHNQKSVVTHLYYDHNQVWSKRQSIDQPLWGRNSLRAYDRAINILKQAGLTPTSIVDFGCGAGAFGNVLSNTHPNTYYFGIDHSREAITLGRKNFPHLDLHAADLARCHIEIFGEKFALVTNINSLHCLTEQMHRDQFYQNAYNYTQENGYILTTTMVGPPASGFRQSPTPRIFLPPQLVIEEHIKHGFENIVFSQVFPANQYTHIPNLAVLCRK